jgi:hypothetical protein
MCRRHCIDEGGRLRRAAQQDISDTQHSKREIQNEQTTRRENDQKKEQVALTQRNSILLWKTKKEVSVPGGRCYV